MCFFLSMCIKLKKYIYCAMKKDLALPDFFFFELTMGCHNTSSASALSHLSSAFPPSLHPQSSSESLLFSSCQAAPYSASCIWYIHHPSPAHVQSISAFPPKCSTQAVPLTYSFLNLSNENSSFGTPSYAFSVQLLLTFSTIHHQTCSLRCSFSAWNHTAA